ncbi:MAG: hypothetical protein K5886_04070 [Lachnospiraceae bacterium]|nr:hypothetical protein [Lachnospiraceae bacterium]
MANNNDWDDLDDSELEDWDYRPKKEPVQEQQKSSKKKTPKIQKTQNVKLHSANIKCPSCGADISVDTRLKTAICEYCGNKYNVHDAVSKSEAVIKAAKKAGRTASEVTAGVARELGKKKKLCENCGTEIAVTAKKCYKCGHKNPVPIYRKTWFWILVIIFIVFPVMNFFSSCGGRRHRSGKTSDDFMEIRWSDSAIAQAIPEPANITVGKVISDSDDYYHLYIGNYSRSDFNDYVSKIKEAGFTEDRDGSDNHYSAENVDGYEINLYYEDDEGEKNAYMNLTASAPNDEEPTPEPLTKPTPEPTTEPTHVPTLAVEEVKEEESEDSNKTLTEEEKKDFKKDVNELFSGLTTEVPEEIKGALERAADDILDSINPSRDCEAIYKEYSEKIRSKSAEYQDKITNEAAGGATFERLTELSGEGVEAIAELNAQGIQEMADYTAKFGLGRYDLYMKWSSELYQVYDEEGTKIFNTGTDKGTEALNSEVNQQTEEMMNDVNRQVEEMMNNMNFGEYDLNF